MTGFIRSPLFSRFLIQLFGFPEFPFSLKRKYAKKIYDWLHSQPSFISPVLLPWLSFFLRLSLFNKENRRRNLTAGFFISPIIPRPNPLKISFFPKKTIFKASGEKPQNIITLLYIQSGLLFTRPKVHAVRPFLLL